MRARLYCYYAGRSDGARGAAWRVSERGAARLVRGHVVVAAHREEASSPKPRGKVTLAEWCRQEGREGLAGELAEPGLTPDDVSYGSEKKVLWRCGECTKQWRATVKDRTNKNSGCPHCSGWAPPTFEGTLAEWCAHEGREGLAEELAEPCLTPDDVSYGSKKKVLWRCGECREEWRASVKNRTNMNSGCPHCSGYVPPKFKGSARRRVLRSARDAGSAIRVERSQVRPGRRVVCE